MASNSRTIQHIRPRKNGRKPSNYPVDSCGVPLRITQVFPLKLQPIKLEQLIDKKEKITDVVCVPEMMKLFDCLSKHEFDKTKCVQQTKSLEQCYVTSKAAQKDLKVKRKVALGIK